jgi:hypothetical protein
MKKKSFMLQDLYDLYSKILNKIIGGYYRDVVAEGHHCKEGLVVEGSRRHRKELSLEKGFRCRKESSLEEGFRCCKESSL